MKRFARCRVSMLLSSICVLGSAWANAAFQLGAAEHVGLNRTSFANTRAALAAGDLSLRDEVLWSRVETEPGQLAFPASLRDLDALVTASREQGHRPLIVLDYGNRFYDAGGLITSPDGIAAFCRYVRFVVRHFSGRVDQFEIWNEWNIGSGSPTRPRPKGPANAYVNLLRAAYAAVKAENPTATVIGGVTEGVDIPWVEAFGLAGGFAYLDAFSAHPYVFWTVKAMPHAAYAADSFRPVPSTPEDAIAKLDALKSAIDRWAPSRNLSVYVTEMGWPTNVGQYGVSESTSAAYAQRFLLLARARSWIGGVWWYDLFDDGSDPREKEHRYGLLHQDGTPKPAFYAIAAIRDEVLSTTASSADITASGRVTVQGRTASGKQFVAAWLATDDFSSTERWSAGESLLGGGFHPAGSQRTPLRLTAAPLILIKD